MKSGQKQKINPQECGDKGVLLPSAYQYICVSISQGANEVPVSGLRQPTPYFQQGKTFGVDAHTALAPAQHSTAESAREVEWGVCVCSFRRALYPGPCQLIVLRDLCTTKLIHSHSRWRAALAAMLPAAALQECRGSSERPPLTFFT